MRVYQAGQFEYDAMHDQLPTVSWIIPTSYQSEHPDFLPAAGADYIASKLDAIAANPSLWEKTVFVLIYDENDGLFDHVTPPTAPAGTPGEWITVDGTADPIGLGFRVPCIVASPWTVGGYVSHTTFDHTSVIQLLESVTGVVNPNLTAWRRSTAGNLASVLGSRPPMLAPRLPGTAAELLLAEQQVREFQLPPIPGGSQTFPVQSPGRKRLSPLLQARRCSEMMTRNRIIAAVAAAGILVGGGTAVALAVSSSATKPASATWRRSRVLPAAAPPARPTWPSPAIRASAPLRRATATSFRPTTSTTCRCRATRATTTTTAATRGSRSPGPRSGSPSRARTTLPPSTRPPSTPATTTPGDPGPGRPHAASDRRQP